MNLHHSQHKGLAPQTLLNLWDRGEHLGTARRALEIISAAEPDVTAEDLRRLLISDRDARILDIRAGTLGPEIIAVAQCPQCGEAVESTFCAEQIDVSAVTAGGGATPRTLRLDGREVVLRPVTAGDLCDTDGLQTAEAARALLLRRAVISVDGEDSPTLDHDLQEQIEEALEQLDPRAVTELTLACPACVHEWSTLFDPARFFWEEIRTLASRLLSEVAELARTYHWSESEILTMTDGARRHYLEMARTWQDS